MQSACHVESANSGKLVYSSHQLGLIQHHQSHTEKQFHCTEPCLLSFPRTKGNFEGHNLLYFNHVRLFSIFIKSFQTTSFVFSILANFISTHMLTGTSGIWVNTVMFSFLKNCHPAFRKTLPFLKKQSSGKDSRHIHTVVCWNEPWIFFVKSNIGTLCRMEWYG